MAPKNKLYELGKKIGLNEEEIDEITKKDSDMKPTNTKKRSLKHSPDEYMPGTTYGTISINEFQ